VRSFLTLLATTTLLLSLSSPALAADISIVPVPERDNKAALKEAMSAYTTAAKTPGITAYTFDGTWEMMQGPEEPMTRVLIEAADFAKTISMPASLTLGLIDANGRTIPPDLKRMRWSSQQMLIQVDLWLRNISRVTGENVKWISFGRDTDMYFKNNDAELEEFLDFYKKAATSARRVFPNAKIGLTITHEGLTGERKAIAERLLAVSDAAFISYYPVTAKYTPKDNETISADIAALGDGSLIKPVILKEFGFPSAFETKETPDAQAKFFETHLPELKNSPAIDLVTISDLHDRALPTCRQDQNKRRIKERDYVSFCSTLGLRESGGRKKAALKVVEAILLPSTAQPTK
jgi:hypothetical protein